MGHEARLPASRLSGCSRFGQQTFAGTHGNGRDAPIAAIPIEPRPNRKVLSLADICVGFLLAVARITLRSVVPTQTLRSVS